MNDEPAHPEGAEFLRHTFRMERACEMTTATTLPDMSNLAPQTWVEMGTCLSLLDRVATCHWGCEGGDHHAEHLVLRAVNSVRAAVRLMRGGFYDEALSSLRAAGELANLLSLFEQDDQMLRRWKGAQPAERWRLASPGRVRKALESLGRPSLLDSDRYDQLSRLAHGTGTTPPQSHNPLEVGVAGGHFQYGGFLVALNEAAFVTALLILPATNLVKMPRTRWERLHDAAERLIQSTDFVGLEQAAKTNAEMRTTLDHQELELEIRKLHGGELAARLVNELRRRGEPDLDRQGDP